jgi:hypothetical protein
MRRVLIAHGIIIGALVALGVALAVVGMTQVRPERPLELSGPVALAPLGLVVALVVTVLSLPCSLLIAYALREPAAAGERAPAPVSAASDVDPPGLADPDFDSLPLAPPLAPEPPSLDEPEAEAWSGGWQVRVVSAEQRDRLTGAEGPASGAGAKAGWLVLTVALSNQTGSPARVLPSAFTLVAADGAEFPHGPEVMAFHHAQQSEMFSLEAPVPAGATVMTPLVFTASREPAGLSLRLDGRTYLLPGAAADLPDERATA